MAAAGLRAAGLLLAASLAAFLLIAAMPSDPATVLLHRANLPATPEAVAALHAGWGLDRPLLVRYVEWLLRFLSGDWGMALHTGQPVVLEFLARLPVSLVLGMGGLALAVAIAIPLGFAAALRPDGLADRASRVLVVGTQAIPAFVVGLVLLWFLAAELRLIRPFTGGAADRLILPVLIVALYAVGSLARVYRIELLRVAAEPFIVAARARGMTRARALWRHGHRHAVLALLAALTPECGWVIGGTAVTEVVFGLPGISQFLVDAIAARDYAVLQAYVVVVAAWMLAVHLMAEAARRVLDPGTT